MKLEQAVPRFYLYGEPHRQVDDGFMHIESLDDRSRPSNWRIRPHAHLQLNHMLHITAGGGTLLAEDDVMSFAAPCLLVVPAGTVHGFAFHPESRGWVSTVANDWLSSLLARDAALGRAFRLGVVALDVETDAMFERAAEKLLREQAWDAPGSRLATEAVLLDMLVALLRARDARTAASVPGRKAALVARLRERMEARFRRREPISAHAAALGVSISTLRAACAEVTGQSPLAMLDDRALLEARRALLYSDLSVAEVGYALGFADPAYFSRFFTRHMKLSPQSYRQQRRGVVKMNGG